MSNAEHLKNLGSQDTKYEYDEPLASQLETFEYDGKDIIQVVGFKTDEFTSLCPKTGQPDFASIDIAYIPNKLGVESKSLKLYLFRYRNHGSFHEDCVNKIATDLMVVLDPKYIRVVGDFTKRGGIAIKPMSEYVPEALRGASKDTVSNYRQLVQQYDIYRFERQ